MRSVLAICAGLSTEAGRTRRIRWNKTLEGFAILQSLRGIGKTRQKHVVADAGGCRCSKEVLLDRR